MPLEVIGVLSAVLSIPAYVLGVKAWKAGRWEPTIITWGVYVVADILLIISGIELHRGFKPQMCQVVIYLGGSALVFWMAWQMKTWQWTLFDVLSAAGAAIGLVFYAAFRRADWALAFAVGASFLGGLPTFKQAILEPWKEDWRVWAIFFFAALVNFFSIADWGWQAWPTWLFPMYAVVSGGLLTLFSARRLLIPRPADTTA